MRCFVLTCCALVLATSLAQAQTTTLRQERIFIGDIAELTIEHDAEIPSLYAMDTSMLDADFLVLNVNPRLSRHVSENRTFHRMQWKIEMVPRREGRIAIPPLPFGTNHSEAIMLQVERAPASIRARENIFIEVEVSPANPYPGQQTRITTRLLHNLPLPQGSLSEPESDQATIFRSGRDSRYSVLRQGENFEVLERSILLIPNPGEQLQASAPNFRATIVRENDAGERHIFREGEYVQLPIREKPAGHDDRPWLPARQLDLALQWDKPVEQLQAGDALGFTLSMEAQGLPAEALPADLLVRASGQYKIYADEALRDTRVVDHDDGEQLFGSLRQRYVIIVQQPGRFTTPALKLSWWDIEQDLERIAVVESRVVEVAASGASVGVSAGAQIGEGAQRLLPAALYRHWPWLTALLVLMLLSAVVAGVTDLRARIGEKIVVIDKRRRARLKLRRACRANDAAAARRALIEWGRIHWKDNRLSGLHHIEARAGSPELVAELQRLDAALFADNAGCWRGRRLWELLAREPRPRLLQARDDVESLPGLYP